MNANSTCEKKELNEIRTLEYVARAGWLPTYAIAVAVWSLEANSNVARRTLARLVEKGFLVAERGTDLSNYYAITIKGARHLNATTGKTYKSTVGIARDKRNIKHRNVSNLTTVYYDKSPFCRVWFEYEIQTGLLPLVNVPAIYNQHKMPDFFVQDKEFGCFWGEVELSKKSAKDRRMLVSWLFALFDGATELPEIGVGMYLRQVVFIAPPEFEATLQKWVADEYVKRGDCEEVAIQRAYDLCVQWTIVRGFFK